MSFFPKNLNDALKYRNDNPQAVPYGGGTDLMVWPADENAEYIFLDKISEMREIKADDEYIRFGAACTFTEVATNPLCPKILKEAILTIAAPAIRNLGTLGGNIGNGSAKADSVLIHHAANAKVRLASVDGERILRVRDFYQGRKKLDFKPNELIVEILYPKNGLDNYYFEKIGARKALAISRVSFAGVCEIADDKIVNFSTAFGAIMDVVLCREDIDSMFMGKTINEAKELKDEYLKAYDAAIVPIRGRVSLEYRRNTCLRILKYYLSLNGI